MSVDPLLRISIDHEGDYPVVGATDPLVFYASDGLGGIGIVRYREPDVDPEVEYADRAGNQHGSIATGWSYPDTLLDWALVTDTAGTESASRLQLATVRAFLGRLRYDVTITTGGAPDETWSCKPGACRPASDRDRNDLANGNPVWNITIPAHPIRSF